ncbi:hypothetical protein C8Q76DRAFT_683865 [Earliella scabrosa]|nr:hypothetical protein C8Q76DRAFT_683865 [Earliella scabrosa]
MKLAGTFSLLVSLLAFITTSLALEESIHVKLGEDAAQPGYAWIIGDEEARRISELLGNDIRETEFLGLYLSAPPQPCSHCGKDTEVIDWMWTALNRGVHSKEMIFHSLKTGALSKKKAHDVYCSSCGHLTHARDSSGEEGGMPHISHATPYDRTSRVFAKRANVSRNNRCTVDLFETAVQDTENVDVPEPDGGVSYIGRCYARRSNLPEEVRAILDAAE